VSLSGPTAVPVSVQSATSDNTATEPGDYQATSGTLTFTPGGATSEFITVTVNGDTLDEPDETYFVKLFGAMNGTIADGLGVGTIVNDDPPPAISVSDTMVPGGDSNTADPVFTVSLSAVSGKTVTAAFATADGTAVAPGDYQPASGFVVFAPGQTTQQVTVHVNGDQLGEANETVLLNLSNPIDGTIADGQGVGVILNDDPTPAFANRSITPTVTEGSVATLRGTISLPNTSDVFLLDVSWGDGTPTESFAFPAGSSGQVVTLTHRYADNGLGGTPAGTYTVHTVWRNQYGGGNSADLPVQVKNVAPVVDAGDDGSANPGGVLNRTGSFTDPDADTWTATVDYGDGSGPQVLQLERDKKFHLHHKYRAPGTYVVTVTVVDDDGGVGIGQFVVSVED
jgi:PKD domain/Calx-beta domain